MVRTDVVPTATRRPGSGGNRRDRDLGDLAVDGVVLDVLRGDGLESPEAHVEREVGRPDVGGGEAGEQFGGEVQAGRGCGGGDLTGRLRVDCLVAFAVREGTRVGFSGGFPRPLDIGWQGHGADAVGHRRERLARGGGEGDLGRAVLPAGLDSPGEFPAGRGEGRPGRELAPRPHEAAPPLAAAQGLEQQALDLAPGGPEGPQPGRQDRGVVAHKEVPRAEKVPQLREGSVLEPPGSAVDYEQSGGVAPRRRHPGDQALRDGKIKAGGRERRHGSREQVARERGVQP
jgi:hypothetical protein